MRLPFAIPSLPRARSRPSDVDADRTGVVEVDAPLFDEALLARLRHLVLISSRATSEGLAGEHRSRRRGASPEFADFKSYSQGDDFRRIDWNTYARLDGLFVRLSEVTTELTIHVLLDMSNSMDWRGSNRVPTKSAYARRIGGALGYMALWHFDRLVVTPFGESLAPSFGPVQGRSNVVPLLRHLERLQPLGQTSIAETLERYVRSRRRPGMLVVISDLLSGEPEELRPVLRILAARGWQVLVMHVLDPAEVTPALAARYLGADQRSSAGVTPPAELLDVESGERLRLSPTDGVLARYAEAIGAWLEQIESFCTDERADYLRLTTDLPVETILLRMLYERGMVE